MLGSLFVCLVGSLLVCLVGGWVSGLVDWLLGR